MGFGDSYWQAKVDLTKSRKRTVPQCSHAVPFLSLFACHSGTQWVL
jgi:hypothetical protein